MDLMARRREMLVGEIYPVGTKLIEKYIGRNEYGDAYFERQVSLNTAGEYVEGSSAGSPIFFPVNPNYVYQKSNRRIYLLTFYDSKKQMIGQIRTNKYSNLSVQTLDRFPERTAYIRFCTLNNSSNFSLEITRIE